MIISTSIFGLAIWAGFVDYFTQFINLTYNFTDLIGWPSYGLAIIFMTLIIKLVMFPLTQKQMKSMRAMQEIQPKAKWLQEKYSDDPQIAQQKLMELYREHGVNPLGGCLPLLIQMPIFIAFYQALSQNLIGSGDAFKFFVLSNISVSAKTASSQYFANMPVLSNDGTVLIASVDIWSMVGYWTLVVLAALTTYLQQRVSMVKSDDPTQKTMLYFMPLLMGWIAYTLPAGLPLYWVTFNILGIIQQIFVNRSNRNKDQLEMAGVPFKMEEESVKSEKKEKTGKGSTKGEEKAEEREKKAQNTNKGGKNDGKTSNNRKKGQKR